LKTNACIAMLLAGGEGRRLGPLTETLAKPAVPFGGRCRIIDYTLSNCIYSGIRTIGVLTQHNAQSLHSHIGDGSAWQSEGRMKPVGIDLLPSSRVGSQGYLGTADAIYQNMDYIEHHRPEHVLVLSGDHIYRMDYRELMASHTASKAAVTIAVKRVSWKDAGRFGILNTDERHRITEFEEKPEKPRSNLASMGIYMFRWADLKAALLEDREDPASSGDIGRDIIPRMLRSGSALQAYPFEGYWRDVGTVECLWRAHMDLIDGEFAAESDAGPILTSEPQHASRPVLGPGAEIHGSYVHPGSLIEGEVDRSVVFGGVEIGKGADVRESVIMPGARIGRDVRLTRAIIGEGAVIEDGAVIGSMNGGITVIASGERVAGHPRFKAEQGRLPHELIAHSEAASASEEAFKET
jgi:glucose-1-phosphate adenylyltransferase